MEFVSDDIAAQAQPTDAELNAYLQAHPDTFRVEPRFTFSQVYLNPEKHGENLARDAAQLLAQLKQAGGKTDFSALGDSFMLDQQFDALPASEVARQFGEKFAATLGGLSPGQWQGPVESGYGVHLVFVSERTEGRLPALADVRDAVRREWDERPAAGSEREVLPGTAQALHRDRRAAGAGGGRRKSARRGEMKRALLISGSARHVCARRVRARGAPRLSRIAPDRTGNLRRALEGAGSGRDLRLGLYVELPAGCTNVTEPRGSMVNNAYSERWTVKCAGGLTGGTIHIAGLSATMTDVLVRLERLDGTTQVTRLTPSAPSFVVEAAPRAMAGRPHLPRARRRAHSRGIDHLLFVLALLILVKGTRRLVARPSRRSPSRTA